MPNRIAWSECSASAICSSGAPARSPAAMVYVSHQADEIRRIASRVVRIDGGRVAGIGGPEQIGAAEAALA
jgi:ABC-type sulfate/molybdate transport systems ATPase subunit